MEPKDERYIYTSRSGIYIIDLKRTAQEIEKSYAAMRQIVQNGGRVLFVGTKNKPRKLLKKKQKEQGSFM